MDLNNEIEKFSDWFTPLSEKLNDLKNSRTLRIWLLKIVKILCHVALFLLGYFSHYSVCDQFRKDFFSYVHIIYVYAVLLFCSFKATNELFIFYNTSYEKDVVFLINFEYIKRFTDTSRTETYLNFLGSCLLIPNELIYTAIYILTKYLRYFDFKEFLWSKNYNTINLVKLFLDILILSISILISSFGLVNVYNYCSNYISPLHICCIILLSLKIVFKIFYYFRYQLYLPKELDKRIHEMQHNVVEDFKSSEKLMKDVTRIKKLNLFTKNTGLQRGFMRFMRYFEHLTEGCILKENCTSFSLEHIAYAHNELCIPKNYIPDVKKCCFHKSFNRYLVGFYPVDFDQAIEIAINGFEQSDGWFGRAIYFKRFISDANKKTDFVDNDQSLILVLVNMGKKLVINNKDESSEKRLRYLTDLDIEGYDSIYLCGKGQEHEENEVEKDEFLILDSRRIVRFLVCLNIKGKNKKDLKYIENVV